MSVREVTFFEVVCDADGCGTKTGDLGGDFSAWADHSQALSDWESYNGGYDPETGKTYCPDHVEKCPECEAYPLIEGHDDDCPTLEETT